MAWRDDVAKFEADEFASAQLGMAPLTEGTYAQREWATSIRLQKCREDRRLIAAIKTGEHKWFFNAKWWIDRRYKGGKEIADDLCLKYDMQTLEGLHELQGLLRTKLASVESAIRFFNPDKPSPQEPSPEIMKLMLEA
ncbi:hypothetical protein ASG11_17865 [Sphingomonas sp. Leaf357]|uniref:hypothetical protein n=1 Tax=Sphingomonas sp. Leaf357 TaxID=1736350 RepID=UPI0006F4884D|nr:hypothetical protein [Sphingomonas sp. Leaf357]KQS01521.1 hypothetical protein ASG11_17865 [Sphingomonas sp. Leaf357]